MEMFVEQALFNLGKYEYKFYSQDQLIFIARANRTIIPTLRKIFLYDTCHNEVCSLKQQDIIRFIISYVPILGFMLGKDCPYVYYSRGIENGIFSERYTSNCISGNVKGDNYVIYFHTGNIYSIFCNNAQMVSIQRNSIKVGDADRYKILYEHGIDIELVAILVVLVDITYQTTDKSISSLNYAYTYQIGGKKQDENWQPKE